MSDQGVARPANSSAEFIFQVVVIGAQPTPSPAQFASPFLPSDFLLERA